MKSLLNEEQLTHTESALIQDGYVAITNGGRVLTDFGSERALQLAQQIGATA